MFPIFDISSKPVAFGGRILPTEKDNMPNLAKYKNSKDSRFYSKKKTLYGLNWAKKEIAQTINSLNRDHLDKSILLKAISVTYGD